MHTIRTYHTLPAEAAFLRRRIFMEEQGFRDEFDETDRTAAHLVLFGADGAPLAVCRYFPGGDPRTSWAVSPCGRTAAAGASGRSSFAKRSGRSPPAAARRSASPRRPTPALFTSSSATPRRAMNFPRSTALTSGCGKRSARNHGAVSLSPTMPQRSSPAKKHLAGVAGSPQRSSPARKAPAAPMPVHTT